MGLRFCIYGALGCPEKIRDRLSQRPLWERRQMRSLEIWGQEI